MKLNTLLAAAALLGLGIVGAAASQPSLAQQSAPAPQQPAGEWLPAGVYSSDPGGEVWMINTRTGAARNCYWKRDYENGPMRLQCSEAR